MSWQAASLSILALVIVGGFVWFERARPPARIVAAVAALAALGVAGRLALAPIPNVVATTDVALLAGYTLGAGPGFAVGALSGLVSNFWLGQGPWTPWQMAGWGMVGIAGAILAALSGRRLGRWELAFAGALAGFAYGALLDLSVMVSFGGEQSLDRYLALSARGLPFNVAHAAGNFALMLAAGPAMVRMLDRYRERFEFRWHDAPIGRAAAGLVLVLCLAAPLLAPAGAGAKGGHSGPRGWLVRAQNDNGGYGIAPGAESSPGMTGWAMLGLEAAGVNPRDVASAGKTPVAYLRSHAGDISSTGDLERTILALDGAGVDPRAFADRDLVAELRDRQGRDGSYEKQVNLTAFAILAQRAAGVDGANFGKPASWLRSIQNRNGGWGSVSGVESEPDSTGAVMQALAVAPGGSNQVDRAVHWLAHSQHGDGGWSLTTGVSSNSQSASWALQGLAAANRSPGAVEENGSSGFDYLAARQSGDGHYAYSSASDQTPVWVTAQGLTGVAREPFPIATVARAPAESSTADPTDDATDPGSLGGLGGLDGGGSYDGYGSGDLGELGGLGLGGGGSSGSPGNGGRSSASNGSEATTSDRERVAANLPGSGSAEAGLAAIAETATPVAMQLPPQDSELPSTPIMVGILLALAAALGAGFLWYRRRLP